MNKGLKAGIGIAAAALVLWGAAMLGVSLLDSGEPKSQAASTQPAGTKTTLHRPGAGTTTSSSSGQSSGDVVNHIELDRYTVTVAVGETEMPWVTMTPEAAEDKREIWSTSDASVATVDQPISGESWSSIKRMDCLPRSTRVRTARCWRPFRL